MLLLLAIPSLSLLFLQNRQVQTRVSQLLAERASENLQASISISSVNYAFFKRVQLTDVLIRDLRGDTLIYSELTKVRIRNIRPGSTGILIKEVNLENVWVNLVIDSTNKVNLAYITDEWANPHLPPERKGFFEIEHITMTDGRFSLSNHARPPELAEVDFSDFHLEGIDVEVDHLRSQRDTVSMQVNGLSTREKKGYRFNEITTLMTIGKQHMHFWDIDARVEDSKLDVPHLGFNFSHWTDFSAFSEKVDLRFISEGSEVNLNDVMDFVPGKQDLDHDLVLDANVSGTLGHFRGDEMRLRHSGGSYLAFDFLMLGLPDFENTFMDVSFSQLQTSVPNILELAIDTTMGRHSGPWTNFGTMDFQGQFTGFADNFVANGLMETDMGKMVMDLSFRPDTSGKTSINGHLFTRNFLLGTLLDQDSLIGRVDLDAAVDGSLDKGLILASLDGRIDTLEISGYSYSNINMDGVLTNSTFNGGFSVNDPNLEMRFDGLIDFSDEIPDFNFKAEVARSNPAYLNIGVADSSTFASFTIETDMEGLKLDELNGEARLINSLFERQEALIQLYDISLEAVNTPDSSSLFLRSDLFNAEVRGRYSLSSLPNAFSNLADKYLNTKPGVESVDDSLNHFELRADLIRMDPILDFFLPDYQVGDSSVIQAYYHPVEDSITLHASFPYLTIGPAIWHEASLGSEEIDNELDLRFSSDSLVLLDAYTLTSQDVHLFSLRDTAHFYTKWDNSEGPAYRSLLRLNAHFVQDSAGQQGLEVDVKPTDLFIRKEPWGVMASGLHLWEDYVELDSFRLGNQQKHLMANGTISRENEHELVIELKNLGLEELSGIIQAEIDLGGNITGDMTYSRHAGSPQLDADLKVDTLVLNQQLIGPTILEANWIEGSNSIGLDLRSHLNESRSIGLSGAYEPAGRSIDMEAHLNDFALAALEPYLSSFGSDPAGSLDLVLTLDGPIDQPVLNGTLDFDRAGLTISSLNTRYMLEDEIRILNNNIIFKDFTIKDMQENAALLNGSILTRDFKELYLNLHLQMQNLLCMNTDASHNEVFYGTIYNSGDLNLNGKPSDMEVRVTGRTERNTALYFPLYNAQEVRSNDYIIFISEEETVEAPPLEQQLAGLNLDLEVDITEDAVVQLIFDPKVGDIIETSGRGSLRILLEEEQGLRMFGDVELSKGDYLFTLQNVINKKFEIEPGGRINFNGSLDNSSIDLEAIYGMRVAPYNLYPGDPGEDDILHKRIPVECRLELLGNLQTPTISTGISMPTADPETRDLLENATSTEEELMKQFLSLLIINNFYSVSGSGADGLGGINSNIAGVTASELLSNQLSNWLSQINENFDVGFSYRPETEVSSSEIEVAVSTQTPDGRLVISGNVDYVEEGQPGMEGETYVMGDVEVEYKITHNVSVLAFNRARDEVMFDTHAYKQGVGISYREDFDSFGELMQRYREAIRQRRERREKRREEKRAQKQKNNSPDEAESS